MKREQNLLLLNIFPFLIILLTYQVAAQVSNTTCNCTCPSLTALPNQNVTSAGLECPCVQREKVRLRFLGGSKNYFSDSSFWDEVVNGFQHASRQTRVQAEVRFTSQSEDTSMTLKEWYQQQIDIALTDRIDGLLISLNLPSSDMSEMLRKIRSSGSGMKYIMIGPGQHTLDEYPVDIRPPLHIGADARLCGEAAAQRVIQSRKTNKTIICLRHQLSSEYDTICSSFVDYINKNTVRPGGARAAEVVEYSLWSQSQSSWRDLLNQRKEEISSIFVLSPSIAVFTLDILSSINNARPTNEKITIGTMHFSPPLWSRLGKDLDFLISQQPFLQGMFGAYMMVQYVTRANLVLRFDTGPVLLTEMPKPVKRKSTSGNPIIEFVAHQQFDPFWEVIHDAVKEANGDSLTLNPLSFLSETPYKDNDRSDQARVMKKYCAYADGLMTSLPDTVITPAAAANCIANGTQVISINSGSDEAKKLKVLTHVGQIEDFAGKRAAEELIRLGMTVAMCITNEGAPTIRCDAFHNAVMAAGLKFIYPDPNQKNITYFRVSSSLSTLTVDLVTDWLKKNLADPTQPKIDGILVLGTESPNVAKGIREAGRRGKIYLCGFDLTDEIFEAIGSGDIHLSIDQQQIMQGYLPVVMMEAHFINGNFTTTSPMQTGPFFVNKDNYLGKYCQATPQCSRSVAYQGPDLLLSDGSKIIDVPVALFSTYNKTSPPYKISGEVVYVGDGCDLSTETGEYAGKILIMDEGNCFYYKKSFLASEAKAIALIIGRIYPSFPAINMTAGPNQKVSIPVFSVNNEALIQLRSQSGKSLSIDTSKYAPPSAQLTWKHISKGAYIALACVAGIMQILLIPMLITLWIYRKNSPSIRAASPTFLLIIGFGCFLGLFSVYFFAIDAELFDLSKLSAFCTLQTWFIGLGFITIVGSLIAKSWRIHKIFKNAECQKSVTISDKELLKMLLLWLTGEIIILAVWTGVGQYEVTLTIDANTQYYRCSTSCTGCAIAWIAYKGLLVAAALYLAFTTRNVHSQYRESQIILFSMYTIIIFSGIAVILILVMTNNPEALFLIESLLVIIFVFSFVAIQYASKIYFAFNPESYSQKGTHTPTIAQRTSSHSSAHQ